MQQFGYVGILVVAAAWSAGSSQAADFPKGTFSVKGPDNAVWAIRFDGEGEFTVTRDGKEAVEGTYKGTRNEVSFTDQKGPFASREAGPGTYKWKLNGDKLTFTKVKDENRGRSAVLTGGVWQKKP